jgi:hypothetical protein
MKHEKWMSYCQYGVGSEPEKLFGVFFEDHSITARHDSNQIAKDVFSDKEEAKAKAKRMNKLLSPGEKKYYKMRYIVREVRMEYGEYVRKDRKEQKFLRIDS